MRMEQAQQEAEGQESERDRGRENDKRRGLDGGFYNMEEFKAFYGPCGDVIWNGHEGHGIQEQWQIEEVAEWYEEAAMRTGLRSQALDEALGIRTA